MITNKNKLIGLERKYGTIGDLSLKKPSNLVPILGKNGKEKYFMNSIFALIFQIQKYFHVLSY